MSGGYSFRCSGRFLKRIPVLVTISTSKSERLGQNANPTVCCSRRQRGTTKSPPPPGTTKSPVLSTVQTPVARPNERRHRQPSPSKLPPKEIMPPHSLSLVALAASLHQASAAGGACHTPYLTAKGTFTDITAATNHAWSNAGTQVDGTTCADYASGVCSANNRQSPIDLNSAVSGGNKDITSNYDAPTITLTNAEWTKFSGANHYAKVDIPTSMANKVTVKGGISVVFGRRAAVDHGVCVLVYIFDLRRTAGRSAFFTSFRVLHESERRWDHYTSIDVEIMSCGGYPR